MIGPTVRVEPYIMNMFRENITDFWYLEERGWFLNNPSLHDKLIKIIDLGLSKMVFVFSGDFEAHIDYLIQSYYESKNEVQFSDFIIPIVSPIVRMMSSDEEKIPDEAQSDVETKELN